MVPGRGGHGTVGQPLLPIQEISILQVVYLLDDGLFNPQNHADRSAANYMILIRYGPHNYWKEFTRFWELMHTSVSSKQIGQSQAGRDWFSIDWFHHCVNGQTAGIFAFHEKIQWRHLLSMCRKKNHSRHLAVATLRQLSYYKIFSSSPFRASSSKHEKIIKYCNIFDNLAT